MQSPFGFRPSFPALVLAAFSALPLHAAVQSRIVTSISDQNRSSVPNTVPVRAKLAADVGEASANQRLSAVTLHFSMTAAQQAALTQLLMDQQNPSSPLFHQWLTPAQFGASFGVSSSDMAKVSSWLTSKGLTIVRVSSSSNNITVSGTVSQMEQAFGTSIHAKVENGQQQFSNITDPTLPTPIANMVTGISGLNSFRPRTRVRTRVVPASDLTPKYTSSSTGDHYIAPGDFYTIYDVPSAMTGSGISIAVVGQTDISTSDVSAFRSASGLSAPTSTSLQIVEAPGYTPGEVSGDINEASLDVEWSGAVAQGANILFVTIGASESASVMNSLEYAITENLAPIVSISYGNCENSNAGGWTQSEINSINLYLQEANAQGITVSGPAGDSGATDCDVDPPADYGLSVDFPGSSPFVTSAGGSMFNDGTSTGQTQYWSTNSSSTTNNAGSALSYIPEAAWNENTSTSTELSAGGGGASSIFSKPYWQVGSGVPNDSSRDVPDIAFNAAAAHDGTLYCVQGSCTSGFRDSEGNLSVVGGTSVAAPSFAGVLAILEQHLGGGTAGRVGNANPVIYGIANSSTYYTPGANFSTNNAVAFNDITTGNNDSPCQQGTPNCPDGGNIGYSAGSGYDQATGWGSINVANFVNAWNANLAIPPGTSTPSGANLSNTAVQFANASNTPSGQPCSNSSGSIPLTITVSNQSTNSSLAAPSGTVQILVDNVAISGTNTAALSTGTTSGTTVTVQFTLNTTTLSSGGHTVSVVYLGDNNYAASKGTLSVDIVSSSGKDFALTPCTATAAANPGASAGGITLTVTPANGFTGTVNLTAYLTAFTPANANETSTTTDASYAFSPTSVSITSSSAGTTSFVLSGYQSSSTGNPLIASNNAHPTLRSAPWYITGSGVSLACVMLFMVPRRRRWGALLALVISVAAISVSGCGSSSSSTNTGGGGTTPTTTEAEPGVYTVNVTATSTTSTGTVLVHTSTVTFTVN